MNRKLRLKSLPARRLFLVFAFALAAALLRTVPLHAAIIVNDTWQDGTDSDPASPTYSENGTDSDLDTNIESAWFKGGDGTLDPVGAGGPERGRFSSSTSTSSASWTTYFTPEGSEVNLANPGDQMKITWVFTPTNVNTSNTSQNFRIAMVDTPSGSRVTADAAPGSAAYTGYSIFGNMGQTFANGSPFQLRERGVASGDLLSTSGNWNALANGGTNGNAGYVSGTQYTFTATMTRTNAGELQIDTSMTGGSINNSGTASVSFLDASPNSFKYDTFALRPSGATTTAEIFDTSLFRVEFTPVPEPACVGLFAVALAGLALCRRTLR